MFFKMKNIYLSCAYNEYANEATMPSIRVYFWNVDVKQKKLIFDLLKGSWILNF